jgi:hypothetical protein
MNIRGFLKWQFAGILTNIYFHGFVLMVAGMVAMIMGCPAPWPQILLILGIVITIGSAMRSWFRLSYEIYESEQRQIVRELERK